MQGNKEGNDQSDEIVNQATGSATFPLCFQEPFPHRTFDDSCFNPLYEPGAYLGRLPCYPPTIDGRIVPPCSEPYVVVQTFKGPMPTTESSVNSGSIDVDGIDWSGLNM